MAEFVMPSLGADMEAGTLVAWLVKPGARVSRGDIVAEVDTDKGVIEVEVFATGTIEKLLVAEGQKVPVGTPLALIREDSEPRKVTPPADTRPSSPAARRLASEVGVALEGVTGTGPGGAITRDDVLRASQPKAEPERMRRAIAAAMERSNREIPHYYVSHTFDVGAAKSFVERRNESRPAPERLLLGALFLKAVALALRDFPELNAGSEHINVGSAISLRTGGLVVGAVHDTDRLSLDELMQRFRDLVSRARRGELRSSELADGTITVTSLGERGVDSVFGVIYPPQAALVGFGRVAERPWVEGGKLVARPLVTASLAADHRVSDGHRGSLFLLRIEQLLQNPESLQ